MNKILALLSLCLPLAASATSVLRADLPALTQSSEVIVRATVTRTEARYTKDHRRIVTDVDFAVADVWKGEPGKTLRIVQPGGVVGNLGQRVSGMPKFTLGEEVVLFLEQTGPVFQVTGLSQGKYRVERSSDGTRAFAIPEEHDARVVDPVTGKEVAGARKTLSVDELKLEVQRLLVRQNALPAEPTSPATTLPGKTTP